MSRDHRRWREYEDEREVDQPEERRLVPGKRTLTMAIGGPVVPGRPVDPGRAWAGILQRKEVGGGDDGIGSTAAAAVEQAAGSAGSLLPHDLRRRYEQSLGVDLSGVRVHTGRDSADSAAAVAARAYTVGQDIHFAEGQYDPSSQEGARLIAHEVAHTVQQRGGAEAVQHKLEVSRPGDTAEVEADQAAAAMVAGTPFAVSSAPSRIARDPEHKEGAGAKEEKKEGEEEGMNMKFTELTIPLGELPLVDADISFFNISVAAEAVFKGSLGVKDTGHGKAESSAKLDGAAKALIESQMKETAHEPFTFESGGFHEPKEMLIAGIEKAEAGTGKKGSMGKFTLYEGLLKRGATTVGEVKITAAAFSWSLPEEPKGKDGGGKIKALPLQIEGAVVLLELGAQLALGGTGALAAGGKVLAALKGTASVDLMRVGLMLAEELAVDAGVEELTAFLAVAGGEVLAPALAGVVVTIGILEIMDDLNVDVVTMEAFTEANRAGQGFENEMLAPGHEYKPSLMFLNNDPYLKGVEAASQVKSAFFARVMNLPQMAKWQACAANPAKHKADMEAAYRSFLASNANAQALIRAKADTMKIEMNAGILGAHFVEYAQRQGLFSRRDRILRLFEQLWPGAWWLGPGHMGPIAYPQTIPRAAYNIAHQLDPVGYPEVDSEFCEVPTPGHWMTPPTLI